MNFLMILQRYKDTDKEAFIKMPQPLADKQLRHVTMTTENCPSCDPTEYISAQQQYHVLMDNIESEKGAAFVFCCFFFCTKFLLGYLVTSVNALFAQGASTFL